MDLKELHAKAARGDREAATTLLPLAIQNRDSAAVLSCWRVLASGRFNAWQAVQATLKAVLATDATGPNIAGAPVGATQVVKCEIIAKALISSAAKKSGDDTAVAAYLEFAEALMAASSEARPRTDAEFGRQLSQTLADSLYHDDPDAIAAHVGQIRASLDE